MKFNRLLIVLAIAVVGAAAGTLIIGRGSSVSVGRHRPDRVIGEATPGDLASHRSSEWTPKQKNAHYGVTLTFALNDPRIVQFADFRVWKPAYLPNGSHIDSAILSWNPDTGKRILQFPIEGSVIGMITEKRLKEPDASYPKGVRLNTIDQPDGNQFRNLQSGSKGIAISISCTLDLSDNELTRIYYSMHDE
jgi:hypothetical protein